MEELSIAKINEIRKELKIFANPTLEDVEFFKSCMSKILAEGKVTRLLYDHQSHRIYVTFATGSGLIVDQRGKSGYTLKLGWSRNGSGVFKHESVEIPGYKYRAWDVIQILSQLLLEIAVR